MLYNYATHIHSMADDLLRLKHFGQHVPSSVNLLLEKLHNELLMKYINKYKNEDIGKVLIHTPDSGAYYYHNRCLVKSLQFTGIDAELISTNMQNPDLIDRLSNGETLLSISVPSYIRLGDDYLKFVKKCKKRPLIYLRQDDSCKFMHQIADRMIITNSSQMQHIDSMGIRWCNMPFYFDPLTYYHILMNAQYLYVHFGNASHMKQDRMEKYIFPITRGYNGVFGGEGQPFGCGRIMPQIANLFYNGSLVGLNVHMKEQCESIPELNERTHIYAACGITQICDNPISLKDSYGGFVISCATPEEYMKEFVRVVQGILMNDESIRQEIDERKIVCATMAHEKYSLFNVIDGLVSNIKEDRNG